jgi:NAD(P)-dependent dehydrogenase (short-subunit alcohol dehydrogenase family)
MGRPSVEGLKGKVIVFAGAGAIATGTARLLGAGGSRLVVGDIAEAAAERAVRAAREAGGDGVAIAADISSEADVKTLIDLAVTTYGRLDGLFNVAAAIAPEQIRRDTNAVDIDLAVWRHVIDVNLTGYLLTLKHALPHMITGGGGSVVNTMSGAAYAGMNDKVAYSVSKAGVGALTRHVARRYGKEGVRANAVAPGLVLKEQARMGTSPEFQRQILTATPAARHGTAEDIGATVAFLFSDLSGWVTGQVLSVDGGTTMRA